MIGHYLLTLTPEQEDRVLTQQMLCYPDSESKCLVQTALGGGDSVRVAQATGWDGLCELVPIHQNPPRHYVAPPFFCRGLAEYLTYKGSRPLSPALAYDQACWRFGHERVNAAIRNRILSNRARRVLQVRELAVAP